MPKINNAQKLRDLAAQIRDNPHARAAIADGFDLLADALTPCEDCAAKPAAPARRAKPAAVTKKAAV